MRVGIVGGGQLARMLMLAGHPLGLEFRFLDPAADACARMLAEQIRAPFDAIDALHALATASDVLTFDFENVSAEALATCERICPIRPGVRALAVSQDRLAEKRMATALGIPVAWHAAVDDLEQLRSALAELAAPAILKTRRLGYDGKGQVRVAPGDDLPAAWQRLGGAPAILEAQVDFQRELSMIAVRAADGTERYYPLTENLHLDGVLALSLAPARVSPELRAQAEAQVSAVLRHLHYVGVLAVEFFQVEDRLVINEIAPRVHNSGHWTIDAAVVSQFENHLRAILDWPLGATEARSEAMMLNWVGFRPCPAGALEVADLHWHDYGKSVRPGRKIGHCTVLGRDRAQLHARLERLCDHPDLGALARRACAMLAAGA